MSDVGAAEEASAEKEVEQDSRAIKDILKEAAMNAARAQGRKLFFYIVKNMKAQAKSSGKSPKSVKIPTKKASALRVGDLTVKGEVRAIESSPVNKKEMNITFVGDSGSVFESVDKNTSYKVVSRRQVRDR